MKIKGIIKRLSKKVIFTLSALLVTSAGILTYGWFNSQTAAAWWDDGWKHRKAVPIATHTAAQTNVYINLTGANDIDTATLISAGKMQSDCGDLRFTKQNGEALSYYIVSGCNTANTLVHVNFDTFPAGAQTIYYYYGNASAENGTSAADFTTEASNYTFGTLGSEETTAGPSLYWKFDEGQGQTVYNSSSSGATTATTTTDSSAGSAVKINDAANFGAMSEAGRQVVKTSAGTLYAALYNSTTQECEVWKSANGSSWSQQDAGNSPSCTNAFGSPKSIAVAIDNNDNLHLAYVYDDGASTTYLKYVKFTTSSNTFGTPENIYSDFFLSYGIYAESIAVDQNSIPHILFVDDLGGDGGSYQLQYTNRVGGSWNTPVTSFTDALRYASRYGDLLIDNSNIPIVSQISTYYTPGRLWMAKGNQNNATSFTFQNTDTTVNETSGQASSSVTIDASGNTWVAYTDDTTNYITLYKHDSGTAWDNADNWHQYTNNNVGYEPSIAVNGSNVYIFYTADTATGNIVYDRFNGSTWLGETVLETGTYQDAKAKWSNYYNNQGSTQIDYLFSDNTDVYWNALNLGSLTTSSALNGTLGANTDSSTDDPSWTEESRCVFGKCLSFDGGDYVGVGSTAPNVKTVSFWVKPKTNGESIIDLDGGTHTITASSGTLSANGFSSPTIYVNGRQGTTLTANTWQQVAVTTSTAFTATNVTVGKVGGTYLTGFIDDFKLYNNTKTANQIKGLYNARGSPKETAAQMGGADQNYLSNGLVGYWKTDESSSTAADSSGNGLTLTNNSIMAYATGKFGNAAQCDGTADYLNTATAINGVKTVSFWVYPAAAANNYFINLINSSAYITIDSSGVVSATGFTSPSIYVNGALNGTVTAAAWNLITITTDTGINANAFAVGLTNDGSNHFCTNTSKLDEIRVYNRALSAKEISDLYNWAPGPSAYWDMEQGSWSGNGAVLDKSGNSTHLTHKGNAAIATGKFGKGATFDGSGDYLCSDANTDGTCDDDGDLDFGTASFTAEGYFKHQTTSANNLIAAKAQAGTNGGYKIFMASDGDIVFEIDDDSTWTLGSGDAKATTTAATYDDGKWHHFAAVKDGTSSIKIYVDGVLDNSTATNSSISGVGTLSNDDPFYIGIDDDASSNPWAGQLDDIKVYNYARTQKQIVSDMNAGHPSVGSPVGSAVGHWKFDEGQGLTANNSGNRDSSLNGVLSGTVKPVWSQSGKFNKALNITDSTSYINVDTDFTVDTEFSVSAWLKPTSVAGDYNTFLSTRNGANGTTFDIKMRSGTNVYLDIGTGSSWLVVGGQGSFTHTANTWYHIVAVANTTGWKIYANGRLIGSGSYSGTPRLFSSTNNVEIGGDGSSEYFPGTIDEVKIYNYALTDDEVKTDYNQGQSLQLGAAGNNPSYEKGAANQEYCVPGEAASCVAPVGRWDFEEGSGSTVNDTSGSGGTGTWYGTLTNVWTAGKIGKAGKFDGSANYVRMTDQNVFKTTRFTVSAWVKGTSWSGNKAVVNYRKVGAINDGNYNLYILSGGSPYIEFHNSSGTAYTLTSDTTLSTNTWYHISATYDGANLAIYINGALDKKSGSITATPRTDAVYFTVGLNYNDTSGNSDYFPGQIDQVRVFDYARSAAQIAWDYNKGAPIGHWKIDECQGTTAYDSSGNKNHGTITIGATVPQTTLGTCLTPTDGTGAWYNGVSGKRNYSLKLDGTDDYVSVAAGTTYCPANITVSAWINPSQTIDSSDDWIVFLFKTPASGGQTDSWELTHEAWTNNIYFGINNSTDANITQILTPGTWYHLVGTYDKSNIKIYLNGKLMETTPYTTDMGCTSGDVQIGRKYTPTGGATYYYPGQIDDVRIYNYALTATQIKQIMNDGAVRFGPVTGAP